MKLTKLLNIVEETVCGVSLLSAIFLMFTNVVLRYVFHTGIFWSEEIVIYLIIFASFMGGSVCSRKRMHLSVDLFPGRLKGRPLTVVGAAIEALSCIVSAVIAIIAFRTIRQMMMTVEVSPAARIPMYIPYSAILLGFGLMTVRFFINVVTMLRRNQTTGT
ncbi:MAG TPA: TRAP transporter small permease [Clostridia bacterium]|nr:TRAP transporter small permease [Clostridia bacterium]